MGFSKTAPTLGGAPGGTKLAWGMSKSVPRRACASREGIIPLIYGVAAAKMGCCHRCIANLLHRATSITLDLFSNSHYPPSPIELQEPSHLPIGWQKSLEFKTGEEKKFLKTKSMSRMNGPKHDVN
ncbi:Uncharacterized protein Fot_27850 [Forsythia ovata]|uniref:Uncharacterized protein n=1 Tax=Forsythia ovata TaxID=205694 RepID=A0ABD1TMH5_9LAMI